MSKSQCLIAAFLCTLPLGRLNGEKGLHKESPGLCFNSIRFLCLFQCLLCNMFALHDVAFQHRGPGNSIGKRRLPTKTMVKATYLGTLLSVDKHLVGCSC